jgi:hypothetical protein
LTLLGPMEHLVVVVEMVSRDGRLRVLADANKDEQRTDYAAQTEPARKAH